MKERLKTVIRFIIGRIFRGSYIPILMGDMQGIRIPRNRGLTQLSMLSGRYEREFTSNFLAQASRCNVIYDIGANFGYFSLLASKNPKANIYCFEPVPDLQKELIGVISANQLTDRVNTFTFAASNINGDVLFVTPDSDETGLLAPALKGQRTDETKDIMVPCRTIDDWLISEAAEPPELIKIDVEGAEGMVLEGAAETIRRYRPLLMVEVHGSSCAEAVWKFATDLEYKLDLLFSGTAISPESLEDWIQHYGMTKWQIAHVILRPTDQ